LKDESCQKTDDTHRYQATLLVWQTSPHLFSTRITLLANFLRAVQEIEDRSMVTSNPSRKEVLVVLRLPSLQD
jgi:hypothetical protein